MISIIIPTLNEEKNLPFLLESIRTQTYQNFEVIIADNNSKDKTREIAKKWSCKVVQGGLPGEGRNSGARVSKGKILFFMDADVVLPKEFLEEVLSEMKKKQLDIAGCYVQPLSDKDIDALLYGIGNLYFKVIQFVLPQAAGHCIVVKKKVHEQIGGFDEDIKLAEDLDYVKRASKKGKFRYLENVKIPVLMRRWDKDGRVNMAIKYSIVIFYFAIFGAVKSDIFNYRFGHYDEDKKTLKDKIKKLKLEIKNGLKDKKNTSKRSSGLKRESNRRS